MTGMSRQQTLDILHNAVVAGGGDRNMELYLRSIMQVESNGNARARNPNSSAKGLFQFIDSTWAAYGGGDVWDPATQCRNVVRMAHDNGEKLERILGREPNAGEYYLAHFAGPGGAEKVLKANPDTPIRDLIPSAIGPNSSITYRGKRFANFTAGDLRQWAEAKMNVDIQARLSYQERTDHTDAEIEEEANFRRQILRDAGWSETQIDMIGENNGLLGMLFFSILAQLFGNDMDPQLPLTMDGPVQNAPANTQAPTAPNVETDPGLAAAIAARPTTNMVMADASPAQRLSSPTTPAPAQSQQPAPVPVRT
jgi:hypothetical protein